MNSIHDFICKAGAAGALLALLGAADPLPPAMAAQFEAPGSIRAAAEQAVLEQFAATAGQVSVEAQEPDPRLLLPACDVPLAATAPARSQDSARVTAEVRCAGSRAWRLHVPVNVTVRRAVVVTAQPLERGKVLAPDDVILAERELTGMTGGYLTRIEAATGQVLRRAVPAGAALTPGLLESPVLIRRGQPVTVQARSGSLTVQAPGVARGDGALGQVIEVQNSSSKKIVQAVVLNERSVEIRLP